MDWREAMYRLLLCMPLCVVLAPNYADRATDAKPTAVPVIADDGSALPTNEKMERLAKEDILAFLENCLRRYNRDVKGYSGTFQKQELIGGKLFPTEVIDIHYRDKPHSVYFEWKQGMPQAERVLFVEGENDNKLLARPASKAARFLAGDVVARDVEGSEARASGRYSLREFGLKNSTGRTLVDWRAAKEAKDLKTEFAGIKKVKEAGDVECFTIRRTSEKPDKTGTADVTLYFDTKNWLQVGTVLKDEKGNLLGAYYFRDLKLNPEFKKDQFQRAALIP